MGSLTTLFVILADKRVYLTKFILYVNMTRLLSLIKTKMQRKKLYLLGFLILTLIGVSAYSVAGSALQGRFSASGKYDLAVTSITAEDGQLVITVKNSSKALSGLTLPSSAISSGYDYVYIDDMTHPLMTYAWKNLEDQAFFETGRTSTLEPSVLEEGTYNIMACVDATSVLTETDETNNCLTQEVNVFTPMSMGSPVTGE